MNNSPKPGERQEYVPQLDYARGFDEKMAETAFASGVNQWNGQNKDVAIAYRQSLNVLKIIYGLANSFLKTKLKDDMVDGKLKLPIDVRKLAERCNFIVQTKDFTSLLRERNDRTYSPVAQLQMRSRLTGSGAGKIAGTISVADTLGETSIRFSIAHELAHYVLRKHNPIGLNYLHEACPGMYPLSDSDELLSDLFAYAILLPYDLFCDIKNEYENDNSRWPIDFSDWIVFLRDKTQMPEYHVVLAYQSIKQYTIALRLDAARSNQVPWLKNLIVYLSNVGFSKSEIKGILSYRESIGKAKELQACLAELIEIIQDEIRRLEVLTDNSSTASENEQTPDSLDLSPEVPKTELNNYKYEDVSSDDFGSEYSVDSGFKDWKLQIIQSLFYSGMMPEELHDIAEKIGVPPECIDNLTF